MKKNLYTADFETTTDPKDCRVWAYAISEIGNPDNFSYGNSLDSFMKVCANPKKNCTYFFHNLKFDGSFIIDWLLKHNFTYVQNRKEATSNTFTTLITDMGAFYTIEVYFTKDGHKVNKVKFLDSLKILNFTVEKIAKDFNLPIRKLDLDYKAYREPNHILTPHEVDYIRNDVEIMSLALDFMFKQGLDKMTISSDALTDFKSRCKYFKDLFPQLDKEVDKNIRQSYKGGFTYLSDKYKEKETGGGVVFDCNSMYPYMLHEKLLPYAQPESFTGEYQQDDDYPLYVQVITCRFNIKSDKIPSIQIKHCASFMPNEYIKSSNGELVTLVLTNPDLELFYEQYDYEDMTYGGGWKFKGATGLFSEYIDHWTELKIKSKHEDNGAMYKTAKLMLNSLYGKFGTSITGCTKMPYLGDDMVVHYAFNEEEDKDGVYVPIASFTTAYARKYIIESSQYIRDWSEKTKGFDAYVYSDTDSIHCLITPEDVEELKKVMFIDDYQLGAWKLESTFTRGKYLRQKCYIEQAPDGFLNTTIAGLPKRLAPLINFDNFRVGFTTAELDPKILEETGSKLTYKHVSGGVILADTDFTIK